MSGALAAFAAGAPGVIQAMVNAAATGGATGHWKLLNDGTYSVSSGGGTSTGNWVNPASSTVAAYYQVKTDVTSGAFTSDPSAGSYIDLSSTRDWTKAPTGTVTFTVTIREKATGIVRLTQAGVTLGSI